MSKPTEREYLEGLRPEDEWEWFDRELGLVVTKHNPFCADECIEAGCTIEKRGDE